MANAHSINEAKEDQLWSRSERVMLNEIARLHSDYSELDRRFRGVIVSNGLLTDERDKLDKTLALANDAIRALTPKVKSLEEQLNAARMQLLEANSKRKRKR